VDSATVFSAWLASQNTSLDNAKNWVKGTEAMLRGELPTARSMALKASRGYRYLLGACESQWLYEWLSIPHGGTSLVGFRSL
jgi:hypothetical protein